MKLGTVVRLSDGREGTICYHNLDGVGGVWGHHDFEMPAGGFGNKLPKPEFLLRDPVALPGLEDCEYVGDGYEVVALPVS